MWTGFVLFLHLIVSMAKLAGPGGTRGLLAEMLLLKHQLMVLNRPRRRAPHLTTSDRFIFGLTCLFVTPARIAKNAVVLSTASLFKFHDALKKRKYCFQPKDTASLDPKAQARSLSTPLLKSRPATHGLGAQE